MGDTTMDALREFAREREWERFHTPENLAKSISIEAAELLECFQWTLRADGVERDGADEAETTAGFDLADVTGELADVLTYCLYLADRLGLDPERIVREKLEVTRAKYPTDASRGRSEKYDRLSG